MTAVATVKVSRRSTRLSSTEERTASWKILTRSDMADEPFLRMWRRQGFTNKFMMFLSSSSPKCTSSEISRAAAATWTVFATDTS